MQIPCTIPALLPPASRVTAVPSAEGMPLLGQMASPGFRPCLPAPRPQEEGPRLDGVVGNGFAGHSPSNPRCFAARFQAAGRIPALSQHGIQKRRVDRVLRHRRQGRHALRCLLVTAVSVLDPNIIQGHDDRGMVRLDRYTH